MTERASQAYITAEELLMLPDDGSRSELIDGFLVRMPPAGALHGGVAATVCRLVGEYVDRCDLGAVCATDTGFIVRRSPDTVRAPDASFVARERIPPGGVPRGYWPFAPDLAVEVVSPNDRIEDLQQKIGEYFAAGGRLVWIMFTSTRTVHVYRSPHDVRGLSELDELSGEDVLPGFTCPVRRLFE